MTIEVAEGERVTITFDGHRCIHARRCVTGQPHVFRANVEGPWIDADAADPEALLHVAQNCPSGAIHVMRKDGGADEQAPVANIVIVRENGPLAFHADLSIDGHEVAFRATLCRCGLSRNKPFCDNSHINGGFVASGEPLSKESTLDDHRPHRPGVVEPRTERAADGDRKARGRVRAPAAMSTASRRPGSAAAAIRRRSPFATARTRRSASRRRDRVESMPYHSS